MVDTLIGQNVQINFDITFPSLPCAATGVDAMDVTGDQQVNVIRQISKQRLDKYGNAIGTPSANSQPEGEASLGNFLALLRPRLASQNAGGCQVSGSLLVNKVAGNFHIALGQSHSQGARHVHHFVLSDIAKYNISHRINHLSFGKDFPGVKYPLDGVEKILTNEGGGVYQYFIKIIPTIYKDANGDILKTNQYSVTDQFKGIEMPTIGQQYVPQLPGVFLIYDISPFMVEVVDEVQSFSTFIINVSAIIGGIFTITGVIDSFIYHKFSKRKQSDFGEVQR